MKKICIQTGCNDNSVQLLLHPFITRHEVCISCLSECTIINNSFAISTVNMNSGDMRVFISLSMMPYWCHLCTLVYHLSFLKKLYAKKTSHFMITSPCKFSFTDAVQFNFHLSLTLKTMQPYPGVFLLSECETPQWFNKPLQEGGSESRVWPEADYPPV